MSYFDYKNKLNFSNYMDQINQLDQTVINQQNKGLELDQLDLQEQTGFINEAIAKMGAIKSTVDSVQGGTDSVLGGLIAQKGMSKLHSLLKDKMGKKDDKEDDEDDEDDADDADDVELGEEGDVGDVGDVAGDLDGITDVASNIGESANEIVSNIGSTVSDLISEGASRIANFSSQIMSNLTSSGPTTTTTEVQPDTIELPDTELNVFTGGDGGDLPSTWTRAGSGEGDIEMTTLGDNNPTTATGEGAFEGGDTSVQNSANNLSNNLENGMDNDVSNAADDLADVTGDATDAADVGEGITDAADIATDAGMAAVDAGVATADAAAATTLSIPVVGEIIMGIVALGGAIFSGVEGANEASKEQEEAQDEQEEAEDKKQEIANQAAQTQQIFKSSNVIPNISSTVAESVTSGVF